MASVLCKGDKCHKSKKKYPKELMKSIGNKNYCEDCAKDVQALHDYVCQACNVSKVPENILRQIELYRKDKEWSYKNIRFALKYFVEQEHGRLVGKHDEPTIGIVPWVYDKMIAYYKNAAERKKKFAELQNFEIKPVKIKIRPMNDRFNYKDSQLIDMEEFADGIDG